MDHNANKSTNSTILPCLAVLGSIISLTVGSSFGKQLFPSVGPQGTAALRVILASVILVIARRPWSQPLTLEAAKRIGIYGIVLGCMNICFYMSLETLPLGIAIAIEFTGPLTVAIISSRKPLDFLWIIFAVIGLSFLLPISPHTVSLNPIGVAFAFLAAVLWGLYIVVGKRVGHLPAGQTTSLGMFTAGLLLLPFGFSYVGLKILQPNVIIAGLSVAIMSSAIPYTLEMYALKRLAKNTFGILLSMEPVVGAISGMFILHETLSWLQWCAISSIMLASIGSAVTARGKEQESVEDSITAEIL